MLNPASAMMYPSRVLRWGVRFLGGVGLAFLLSLPLSIIPSLTPTSALPAPALDARIQQLNRGIQLYQADQIRPAAVVFEQLLQASPLPDVPQGLALNYLSLIDQQQGQWKQATDRIEQAIATLQSPTVLADATATLALAQALNTRGQLQLNLGQAEVALVTWEQATTTYRQANDLTGLVLSLTNQAQALQVQGLYRQALLRLFEVAHLLQSQPNSPLQVRNLRSLGNAFKLVGEPVRAREMLQQSLKMAESLGEPEAIAATLVSLGHLEQSQQNWPAALTAYQRAVAIATQPLTRMQAQLNQLVSLLELTQLDTLQALLPTVQTELAALPPSRTSIYGYLALVNTLIKLHQVAPEQAPAWLDLAKLGAIARQQAQQLGDLRAQAYATGVLGQVYEQTQQWEIAQELTQQALFLAQSAQAPDITYRWQWQAGRLWQKQGTSQQLYKEAIAAYQGSVTTLKSLRRDLAAVNPDVQFSFRDSVEPVYREFVSLLLNPPGQTPSTQNLIQARNTIEALQLAELEDFFRQSCLDAQPVQIDHVDPTAAVIYPIVLRDRLEVIASLPGQPLRHYQTPLAQTAVEAEINKLLIALLDQTSLSYLPRFQTLYNWLILPIEPELSQAQVKTLVFVLDGAMRNVPMAALHDGHRYLVEQYGIALTPGLQLLDVKPLQREQLQVLTGGLTQARQGFDPLPSVASEIQQIQSEVPSQVLLNEAFTNQALELEIQSFPGPIIHLATHGEFSSRASGTFILTWDGRIDINQLHQLLQTRGTQKRPIELLVLSACRTALGDNQAALGLAGVAVRAGARSTIGTLWYVDDEATASIMARFYRELGNAGVSKAEALRQAQLTLLHEPGYRHPYFWAAYLLVGNWL